ncbi:unnamed protein product, partial [Allacma fusca]
VDALINKGTVTLPSLTNDTITTRPRRVMGKKRPRWE